MISDDVKASMRAICAGYPTAQSGMLRCLHLAQETEGYITLDGMRAVAEATGTRLDEVDSVITFYTMFHREPVGAHVIKVCTSISCYLRGCDDVLAHLEARLGVRRGETTPDGKYTLKTIECLAACGMAPALQVNDEFVENVTTASADTLLARLERGESVAGLGGHWNLDNTHTTGNGAGASSDAARAGARGGKAS